MARAAAKHWLSSAWGRERSKDKIGHFNPILCAAAGQELAFGAEMAARALFSFIFFCVFKEDRQSKKNLKNLLPSPLLSTKTQWPLILTWLITANSSGTN